MEVDDEFGYLYSDVIPSSTTSVQPHLAHADSLKPSPADRAVASNDEDILYGASQLKNSNSALDAPIQRETLENEDLLQRRRFDSNLDLSGIVGAKISSEGKGVELNFMEEDDGDLNFVVEETDPNNDESLEKQANVNSLVERNETVIDHAVEAEQMILVPSGETENRGGARFEDEWESDESEDDLQIVLNDNHVQMRIEGLEVDNEDGEALVIVADDADLSHGLQQTEMEERERGGEEEMDAETKELGDVAKAAAAPMAAHPKIGYNNHMYHHQPYHSQFKVNHLCPMRTSILIGI